MGLASNGNKMTSRRGGLTRAGGGHEPPEMLPSPRCCRCHAARTDKQQPLGGEGRGTVRGLALSPSSLGCGVSIPYSCWKPRSRAGHGMRARPSGRGMLWPVCQISVPSHHRPRAHTPVLQRRRRSGDLRLTARWTLPAHVSSSILPSCHRNLGQLFPPSTDTHRLQPSPAASPSSLFLAV